MLNFGYGINVITGPNGAGKTSILDAISFALFNDHTRGRKDKLINSSAKRAEISVVFAEAGREYEVDWAIERKKAAQGILYFIKNGGKIPISSGGPKSIAPEVERILGMDKNLFKQSVYIPQGEIETLVTAPSATRKQMISKLLGIEYLEKAWANMREIIRVFEHESDRISGILEKAPELRRKIAECDNKIRNFTQQLQSTRQRINVVQSEIERLEKEIGHLNNIRKTFMDLNYQKNLVKKDIKVMEEKLREKQKELEKAEQAKKIIEELKADVEKIPILEEYVSALTKQKELKKEQETLQKILDRVMTLSSTLSSLENRHKEYEAKQTELRNLREQRKNFEGSKQSMKKAQTQLKTYETEESSLIKELDEELTKCFQILHQSITLENLHELEGVLSEKKKKLQEHKSQLENKIQNYNQSMGKLQQRIKDLEDNLSKISEAQVCPLCGRELTPEHREKLQEEFNEEKRSIEAKIANLRDKNSEAEKKIKEIEKEFRKILKIDPEKMLKLAKRLTDIKEKIKKEKGEIKELKRKINELEKIDNKIKQLEERLDELKEDYTNYEVAKKEIIQYAPKEQIEEELKPIEIQLQEISKKLGELEARFGYKPAEPEKELKDLRKKRRIYDRKQPIAEKFEALKQEVSSIQKEMSQLKLDMERIENEIEKLAYDEKQHEETEEELKRTKEEENNLKQKISELETGIKIIGNQKLELQKELEGLSEKEKEKTRIDRFIQILNKIRQTYSKDGAQKIIRARAKPLLERFTRESFERFNLEYSDVKIDDDYNIDVAGPQGIRSIDQISGGERVALAFALRLAIARLLAGKVEALILDEPTTHLDEERRKELVNILNSFFREGGRIIPQIIVITHHEELEEAADVIYNIRKVEGYSTVVPAEEVKLGQ